MENKVLLWIKAIRAPFFTATSMSAVIAAALAYSEGSFNWAYFASAILIIAGANCGINLINDYFDHKSNNDEINKYHNPFSGGSRVIQDRLIRPKSVLIAGLVSLGIVALIGLYFVIFVSIHLLWFGLIAIGAGYFYTASPLKLVYRGYGELIVFLKSGPIAVCGTYFLLMGTISFEAILISIPQGLLVAAILFINEFPDFKADKSVNKRNLVVLLGRRKARFYYLIIIISAYLAVIIPVILRILPLSLLLILISLPFAIQAARTVFKDYNDEIAIIPAQAKTIFLTLSFGVLISVGYILTGVIF